MRNTSKFHGHSVSLLLIVVTLFPLAPATAVDTITPPQLLTYNQTLLSAGEVFELGFFSPGSSGQWYVGIWYKNVPDQTIVWVANRNNPLKNSSGILSIGPKGNIILTDGATGLVWSSNQTSSSSNTTVAQLLDSGNFVVRQANDVDPANYLWQSFDYPTDTLLPGMKLGWDAQSGLNRYLTSWNSSDDPSSGDYSNILDIHGFPEINLWNKRVQTFRSGPWNGFQFDGITQMHSDDVVTYNFVMQPNAIYYSFSLANSSVYSRLKVDSTGILQRYAWVGSRQVWSLFWFAPGDQCDMYEQCGPYGVCDTNDSPVCNCVQGFSPKNPQEWKLRVGSQGCVRRTPLNCSGDGFLKLEDVKLPDTSTAFVDRDMSLAECETACLSNCSCTGYANADITGSGSGCVIWMTDLLDMREYAVGQGGQDLFIKLAAADLGSNKSRETGMVIGMAVGVGVAVFLLGICTFFVWKKKLTQRVLKEGTASRGYHHERLQDYFLSEGIVVSRRDYSVDGATDEFELPLFDFGTMAMATDKFSDQNKLGEGGFGVVYRGVLAEGEEIAVKRLSKNSGQGVEEFKNEVRLIARLQHRNLVRLLGCCIETEEKMLVYEYLENKSLDFFLFDKERSSLLDWRSRFSIICGIARGLLYLHEDSRFKVIHRDLKASNVLLDRDLNPKISDFGMARLFGGDQTEAETKRIVGTYGYMSPEYAMDGHFSVKSDVFSFGVIVLEIVTGKKNRGFYYTDQEHNLLGQAWKMWREGKGLELRDPSAGDDSYSASEVLRCIHLGLLCVQERGEDRPTMSTVVVMLSSEGASMPQPKHPGFCLEKEPKETVSSSIRRDQSFTANLLTVTVVDGR